MQTCTHACSSVARKGIFLQAAPVRSPKASRVVAVSAFNNERDCQGPSAPAMFAAAAAAVLLTSSPVGPALASEFSTSTVSSVNPQVMLADQGEPNFLSKLWNKVPKKSPVKEDPFGADRYQSSTIADTKRSMPIITEQEAVAPEAFPNPSQDRSPRPPVLAAAEGDEQRGPSAGQFEGLDESGRQGLIDAKSPAQASNN